MSINDFVSFLIVPGLVILYFSMKNLLPNYFNEKGRNLATKEDISEITSLVEEVKHSFTTETEKLKANLLLLTNVYAGIVSEERNAIIDYNEKFFLWLNLVSDISLGHTNKNNNAELDEFEKHIHDVYYNVLNSETKFKLFVNNDDLINLGNEMQIKALELLVPNLISYIYDLKINNCETENAQLMKEYDSIAKLREQTDKLHDDFTKTLIKNYKIVLPISVKFQESCRDHIYKLISSKVPH